MTDTSVSPPDIRLVPHLVRRRAPFHEIQECYLHFAFPPNATAAEWADIVGSATAITGSALAWMSAAERAALHESVRAIVVDALTRFWPRADVQRATIRSVLADFIAWLETQPDDRVLDFCWTVLSAHPRRHAEGAYAPLLWMKWSGRLSGAISYENIELAITLLDEANAMYWWPAERWRLAHWLRDSQPYMDGIIHSSCVVRAAAARALGELFFGCSTQPSAHAPRVSDVMALVGNCERQTAGVAAPFLQGAHWSTDPFLPTQDFDFRSWFLDILRTGGQEPWIPQMQSIEFYAHEFFARDGAAIEEMLRLGREQLALVTATAAPDAIPELMPVLQKMSASANPRVAQAIRKYMVVRRRHAGVGAEDA